MGLGTLPQVRGLHLNGLDLFSGIGGISIALKPWVRTVAYCERDRYAQAVLLSRMLSGELDRAPIWDDIASLRGAMLPSIDIIFGGFPCQDISVAGLGRGLDGERSGLFFEIMRLAEETQPKFIFLENVPAIRTRGASRVGKELADRGYDCRWTTLSAQEVGANHKRERWFLLAANTDSIGLRDWWQRNKEGQAKADLQSRNNGEKESLADAISIRSKEDGTRQYHSPSWWQSEPNVGRVVNGLPAELDFFIFGSEECDVSCFKSDSSQAFSEVDLFNREVLRKMWELREIAATSPELYLRSLHDSLPSLPQRATCHREVLGARLQERGELQNMWRHFYSATEQGEQALWQSRLLERIRQISREEEMAKANRVDRLRCLGNAVVPLQAREAFKELLTRRYRGLNETVAMD